LGHVDLSIGSVASEEDRSDKVKDPDEGVGNSEIEVIHLDMVMGITARFTKPNFKQCHQKEAKGKNQKYPVDDTFQT
jgi:hypothetical protein